MAQAQSDQNRVTTILGASNADGSTPVIIYASPTTHRLFVDAIFGANGTIGDGQKLVTTHGTAVKLSASSVPCLKVTIQALLTNTGSIAVGASDVAANGTIKGIVLFAGSSITLTISDLTSIYIDSTVDGEGVSYLYET